MLEAANDSKFGRIFLSEEDRKYIAKQSNDIWERIIGPAKYHIRMVDDKDELSLLGKESKEQFLGRLLNETIKYQPKC